MQINTREIKCFWALFVLVGFFPFIKGSLRAVGMNETFALAESVPVEMVRSVYAAFSAKPDDILLVGRVDGDTSMQISRVRMSSTAANVPLRYYSSEIGGNTTHCFAFDASSDVIYVVMDEMIGALNATTRKFIVYSSSLKTVINEVVSSCAAAYDASSGNVFAAIGHSTKPNRVYSFRGDTLQIVTSNAWGDGYGDPLKLHVDSSLQVVYIVTRLYALQHHASTLASSEVHEVFPLPSVEEVVSSTLDVFGHQLLVQGDDGTVMVYTAGNPLAKKAILIPHLKGVNLFYGGDIHCLASASSTNDPLYYVAVVGVVYDDDNGLTSIGSAVIDLVTLTLRDGVVDETDAILDRKAVFVSNSNRPSAFFVLGADDGWGLIETVFFGCTDGKKANELSNACDDCVDGTISEGRNLDEECMDCLSGETSNAGHTQCFPCPVGTYAPQDASPLCKPCLAGYYVDYEEAYFCDRCTIGSYAPSTGSSTCLSCGSNMKTGGVGATSQTMCVPTAGYWTVDGTYTALECSPSSACLGGAGSPCASGYSGYRCGDCEDGYYKLNGECHQCGGGSVVIFILAIFGLAGVLAALTSFAGGATKFKSLSMSLSYLQIVSFFATLGVEWPEHVKDMMNILSIFMFNLEVAAPECQNKTLSSAFARWMIAMLIPVVAIIILLLIMLVLLVCRYRQRKYLAIHPEEEETMDRDFVILEKHETDAVFIKEAKELMTADPLLSQRREYQKSYRSVIDRCIGALIIFMVIAYLLLGSKSVSIFNCRKLADGKYYYVDEPSIECYKDDEHMKMIYAGIFFVPIYVIAFPSALLIYIVKGRQHMNHPAISMKLGFLSSQYQIKYLWWEIVVIVQKILIVIMGTFLSEWTVFSVGLILGILFVATLLHVVVRPHSEGRIHKEQTFLLINSCFILLIGLMFLGDFPSNSSRDGTGWVVVAVICLALLIIILVLVAESIEFYRSLDALLPKRAKELVRMRKMMCKLSTCIISEEFSVPTKQYFLRCKYDEIDLHLAFLEHLEENCEPIRMVFESRRKEIQEQEHGDVEQRAEDGDGKERDMEHVERKAWEKNVIVEEDRKEEDHKEETEMEEKDICGASVVQIDGTWIEVAKILKRSVIYGDSFRQLLLEFMCDAQRKDLHRLQHLTELLETNVVKPHLEREKTTSCSRE
eukprot:TRINITY_DN835_c0_g1_i11.p1 TRINITY_DN835_c0_g1~~TRINITY_DN835_c0_g1_i11.p1  ORF type:complete len:1167 (+),score=328.84 TRINITY_DN835_c0_g1_i11:125-3625(+)